ncbi:MerR family DNA-binding protein, partial [Acidobacteriia bacterium AH_259_A11_L15]|nr:MerR family DNA-binding protein [Acidobacteriia bacterium AH_259_A11_L15]
LRFIKQAQALGFSLEEIKEILRLKYGGRSPCDCVRGLLEEKLRRVEQEMAALQRFRQELKRVLARSRTLPRLPHRASAICPIIQIQPIASAKKERR